MTVCDILTEAQQAIIKIGLDDNYPLEQSIIDINVIAALTELKVKYEKLSKAIIANGG